MVAQGVGTAVGLIGSTLASGMFTNAGAVKSYRFSRALQEHAAKLNYDYGQKALMNNASSMRKGLVNAGYNPMLAVQNSTSGANSNFTSAQSGPNVDYSGALNSAISNAQSFQRLENETKQSDSTVNANNANAGKAEAETAEIIKRLPFVDERQKKEISKLEADTQLVQAQKNNLKERLDLDRQLGFAGIDANVYGSNVQREKNLIELDKTIRYNSWAKNHPLLASISETAERHPSLFDYGRDYLNYKRRYDGDYDEDYKYTYDLRGRRNGYTKSRRKR